MAVVDGRFTLIPVPAVQLHTAAALVQSPGRRQVATESSRLRLSNLMGFWPVNT